MPLPAHQDLSRQPHGDYSWSNSAEGQNGPRQSGSQDATPSPKP